MNGNEVVDVNDDHVLWLTDLEGVCYLFYNEHEGYVINKATEDASTETKTLILEMTLIYPIEWKDHENVFSLER